MECPLECLFIRLSSTRISFFKCMRIVRRTMYNVEISPIFCVFWALFFKDYLPWSCFTLLLFCSLLWRCRAVAVVRRARCLSWEMGKHVSVPFACLFARTFYLGIFYPLPEALSFFVAIEGLEKTCLPFKVKRNVGIDIYVFVTILPVAFWQNNASRKIECN